MHDVDMMDENADEMMPEELDDIATPNWQQEVRVANIYFKRVCSSSILSSTG
jgi:hypothetical protein